MINLINKFKQYIKENKNLLIEVFAFTFGFGLIAHGYAFFNANFNHDSLYGMIGDYEYNIFMLQIGRFIRPIWARIRGNIALPTLIGFISLFFVSCSNYLIVRLLKIKNKVLIALSCGILITNYTVALTYATYIHDADIYAISLFLSVLSVYIFTNRDIKFNYIIGVIIFVISLGIYQSFLQVTIYLLMILAIERLINNEKTSKVVVDNLLTLLCIVISIVIYYAIYLLTLKVFNVPLGDSYNSLPGIEGYFDLGSLAYIFEQMFKSEKMWLFGKNAHHWWMILGINLLCIVLIVYSFIKTIIERKTIKTNVVVSVVIMLLMPIGVCSMCVISRGLIHDIMTYSYFLFYIFVFKMYEMAFDDKETNFAIYTKYGTYLCICALLMSNLVYSNEVYIEKELMEQTTLSTMTRVIDRMEQTEGYKMGETPVMMVGVPAISKLSHTRTGFMNTGEGTNVAFTITYQGLYEKYFNDYLAYPINLVDDETVYHYYFNTDGYLKDMPCFPKAGSVQFYNDMLVVKIADYGDH